MRVQIPPLGPILNCNLEENQMSNALVARMGNADAITAYTSALYNIGATLGSYDGRSILRLDKDTGEFIFGEGDTYLAEDDLVAVMPTSFKEGWIAFTDKNDLAETVNGDAADFLFPIGKAPTEDDMYDNHPLELPKRGREPEYKHQLACEMVIVSGPNKGEELVYKTTSTGGRRMMAKLAAEIGRKMERGDELCVPVVELFSSSYHNKKFNSRVYNPEFDIEEWVSLDSEDFDGGDEQEEERNPKRGERTAKGHLVDDRKSARGKKARDEEEEDDGNEEPEEETRRTRGRGKDKADDDGATRSRGRGRSRNEEEEDEAPTRPRGRGRSRAEEDEGEAEEKPARRSRGRRDEADDDGGEQDEKPARRSRSRGRDDEADDKGSSGRGSGPRGAGRSRSGRSRR